LDSIRHQVNFCARWLYNETSYQDRLALKDIPPIKLSTDHLTARNDRDNGTHICSLYPVPPDSGLYYYEVILLTCGEMSFGWCTRESSLFASFGIGLDKNSVGIDGSRARFFHDSGHAEGWNLIPNLPHWKPGKCIDQ